MNVLITGSCGFIGYFVSLEFLKNGFKVFGIDNLNNYYNPLIKKFRLNILKEKSNYFHINLDLSKKNDFRNLRKFLNDEKISLVIHLAAYPGVKYSLKNPSKYIKNNIIATENLFNFINKNNSFDKKVILASTSSVYTGNPLPYKEDSTIKEFLSPYSYTKFCSENIAKFYSSVYNFKVVVLRYFTVYGPYNRPDMAVYQFFEKIVKNKPIFIRGEDIKRDFTYVEDVAKATFQAHKLLDYNNLSNYEIINIGSNKPLKVLDLVNEMFKITGKKTKVIIENYSNFEPKETWADIEKAKKLLNFNPLTNLTENLNKTFLSIKEFIEKF